MTHDLIEQLSRTSGDRLEFIEKLEHFPYTQNLHYYQENKDKLLANFKKQRHENKLKVQTSAATPNSSQPVFGVPSSSQGFNFNPAATTVIAPAAEQLKATTPKGPSPEAIQAALTSLAAIGINVKKEDLSKLHGNDAWEEEVEMMADVQAYLKISRKVCPLAIRY